MSTGTGVNVSKANVYAVLSPPVGVSVSKANLYAVLNRPPGVSLSKANLYAVLAFNNLAPPVWPLFTFGTGVIGVPYSQQWDLTPAAMPTTYTLQAGTLPTGLSLSSPSADLGVLSGTPTVAATYSFTLRATNIFGTADKAFTLTIVIPSGGGGASYTFLS